MAHDNHGHTPAAWTAVILVFLGFVVGGIAVLALNWPLFWIGGAGLVVAGLIAGKVMQMMGLGQTQRSSSDPHSASPAERHAG
jgi:xanthine/uracil permease